MSRGMFNEDQEDYMRYLDTVPPEKLCWCGWYHVGECFGGCNREHPGKTAADKLEARRAAATGGKGEA